MYGDRMTGEERIAVDRLQVGVYIRLDNGWMDHPFLFNRFKIRDPEQIDLLKQAGVRTVFWVPGRSDRSPLPEVPEAASGMREPEEPRDRPGAEASDPDRLLEIKRERVEALRRTTERLLEGEKKYEESLRQVRRVMRQLTRCSGDAVRAGDILVRDIVQSILADRDIAIYLVNIQKRPDEYYHALNVTILSLMLAQERGLGEEEVRKLGLGSLFHDVGKSRIPIDLTEGPAGYSSEELRWLRLHPVYGEEMIAGLPRFEPASVDIVRHHHECLDGSGYPDALEGEGVSVLCRMVAVADRYESLCNGAGPQSPMTPHQACAHLFVKERGKLEEGLLTLFIRSLGVYPPGTIVHLSNGLYGLVVVANGENSLRPTLRVYNPVAPMDQITYVDLQEEPGLSIADSVPPADVPEAVYLSLKPREQGLCGTQELRP